MGRRNDEEATAHDQSTSEFTVREDSASKAAGHVNLELVDDKIGECLLQPETANKGHQQAGAEAHLKLHAADSSSKGVMKGWKSGAGSWFDAWLTSAAAQVCVLDSCVLSPDTNRFLLCQSSLPLDSYHCGL